MKGNPLRLLLLPACVVCSTTAVSLSASAFAPSPAPVHRAVSPAGQSGRPLPDLATVLARVRENLRHDEDLDNYFAYRMRRRDVKISLLGKVTLGDERQYEVYPWPEPGRVYRRLVAVNGVSLPPEAVRARDDDHRARMQRQVEARRQETAGERERRLRRAAERARRTAEEIDDAFRSFDVTLTGREWKNGYPTIAAVLTPRTSAAVRSDLGKYMRKFRGRAWVTEDDFQFVCLEMEANETVSVGLGFVARIFKGSKVTYTRRPIDNVWLPTELRIEANGRTALFQRFNVSTLSEYWDYTRAWSVDGGFAMPVPEPRVDR